VCSLDSACSGFFVNATSAGDCHTVSAAAANATNVTVGYGWQTQNVSVVQMITLGIAVEKWRKSFRSKPHRCKLTQARFIEDVCTLHFHLNTALPIGTEILLEILENCVKRFEVMSIFTSQYIAAKEKYLFKICFSAFFRVSKRKRLNCLCDTTEMSFSNPKTHVTSKFPPFFQIINLLMCIV
jgi:hypothetical protein